MLNVLFVGCCCSTDRLYAAGLCPCTPAPAIMRHLGLVESGLHLQDLSACTRKCLSITFYVGVRACTLHAAAAFASRRPHATPKSCGRTRPPPLLSSCECYSRSYAARRMCVCLMCTCLLQALGLQLWKLHFLRQERAEIAAHNRLLERRYLLLLSWLHSKGPLSTTCPRPHVSPTFPCWFSSFLLFSLLSQHDRVRKRPPALASASQCLTSRTQHPLATLPL